MIKLGNDESEKTEIKKYKHVGKTNMLIFKIGKNYFARFTSIR